MKLKISKFSGEASPDPPSCFCILYCKRLKAGQGLGMTLHANIVCPRCALALALFWLLHWFSVMLYASEKVSTLCIVLNANQRTKMGETCMGMRLEIMSNLHATLPG